MARSAPDVDKSTGQLAPEVEAIVIALAKEAARRDHIAALAKAGVGGGRPV